MKSIDYMGLLLVIVVGVAGGNLLSNWISVRVAAYALDQAVTQAASELAEWSEQERIEARKRNARQQAAIEEGRVRTRSMRAAGNIGQDLARRCQEWRQADESRSTLTTQLESRKHCDRYEEYLRTGRTRVN